MNKIFTLLALSTLIGTGSAHAGTINIGDSKTDIGGLNIGGAVRGAYVYKDFADDMSEGSTNGQFKFLDIKLMLNYENPNWLASFEARCYQYDRLCDAVFIRDAWLGYKLNEHSRISAGQQDVEFGFGRYWGNTNYGSLFSSTGFEGVENVGIKYNLNQNDYAFTLGFYPKDGGNFKGVSKDSSRYGVSYVEADDIENGTHIEEENIWATRFAKTFKIDAEKNFKTEVGASYLHSDLDNRISGETGKRDSWNAFATTDYQNWQWLIIAGQQKVDNADALRPNDSTLGARDFSYQVANDGKFMLNEINYSIKQPFENVPEIKPYLSYGKYYKDQQGYLDSERINAGVYFFYKDIGVQAEYIISKNDPAVGGSSTSLAQGDNQDTNKMFAFSIGYFF